MGLALHCGTVFAEANEDAEVAKRSDCISDAIVENECDV